MPPSEELLERRCPRLGHIVALTYCLKAEADESVCPKVLDCWWEIFDVAAYLKPRFSSRAWAELCLRPPAAKVTSLLEQIEQARTRLEKEQH